MIELRDVAGPKPELVRAARHLLDHALPLDLGDDRFDQRWADELLAGARPFIGALAIEDGHPIGYLGGLVDDNRVQLDALVCDHGSQTPGEVFDQLLRRLDGHQLHDSDLTVEIWGKPAADWHHDVAVANGFSPLRALHQMRTPLPVAAEPLSTRPFRPGVDDEALRLVNNAAFVGHPDQGDLSPEEFEAKLAEPGVSADGVRLFDHEGRIAGFCITKIHHDRGLGEIYAIGLDPAVHGRGLGAPMTAAGLHWLAEQGLETGMLYVEADNTPAIRTYERLGFTIARTDRAWIRPFTPIAP